MPLVPAKCTQCGSNLTVEPSQEATICPFCNTPFITEKAINNYSTTNNINANTVNIFQASESDFVVRARVLEKYNGTSSNIVIPDGVSEVSAKAFENCSKYIESMIISEGVKKVILSECLNLTKLELPSTLEELYLHDAEKLKYLTLPNGIKTVYITNSGIIEIDFPSSVEKLIFKWCPNIKKIAIPNGIVDIENDAFEKCSSLETVILPPSIKTIGEHSFQDCVNLKNINLPNGLLKIKSNLGDSDYPFEFGAFRNCKSLTSIEIPNSVERIGSDAFYGCSNLKYVKVNESLLNKSYNGDYTHEFRTTPFDWKYCGRCQHCGGRFKGLFTKVCERCKKEKDY